MKKLAYILLLSIVSSIAVTSCSEQEVKPKGNPGAVSSDPKG